MKYNYNPGDDFTQADKDAEYPEIEMECTLLGRAIEGDIAAQIELNYQYNVAHGLVV